MKLTGKSALITGASRNIGRAIALAFAAEGANLILNARTGKTELHKVAAECEALGVTVLPVIADVSDKAAAFHLVESGLHKFGKIDTLVSNAAIKRHDTPFPNLSVEDWHAIIAVNLHATFYLAKALVPSMIQQQKGSIIAIGGMASVTGLPTAAPLVTSKAALTGLMHALAAELGPQGIRANVLIPSSVETVPPNPHFWDAEREKRAPLRRQGRPEEIAAACVFLASDDASYVTGASLSCTGGWFMN